MFYINTKASLLIMGITWYTTKMNVPDLNLSVYSFPILNGRQDAEILEGIM